MTRSLFDWRGSLAVAGLVSMYVSVNRNIEDTLPSSKIELISKLSNTSDKMKTACKKIEYRFQREFQKNCMIAVFTFMAT